MRRAAAGVLLLAGCGGEPAPVLDPFEQIARDKPPSAVSDRTAPRWEAVATVPGAGAGERTVRIADAAVQWRARWRCTAGAPFVLETTPAPARGGPLAKGRCPGAGLAEAAGSGAVRLRARGGGDVRVVVEQQVTTPLREPPLAAMRQRGARVVAQGRFVKIDRRGEGRAVLHRLPRGRLALRLEGFATAANTDLFVWTSPRPRPRTSRAAVRAPHRVIAPLKATIGDQNYLLPRDVRAEDVRSVVIWCAPLRFAYVAAGLAPV